MRILFDEKELEEISRRNQERKNRVNPSDSRKKQIYKMKSLGTCICGKPSAVPTGWCIECWNRVENEIIAEVNQPKF
ncbi:hypothetical protein [Clostridium manihotivorum]|nr:hypothetical protein [Clostridium manihotivorum]